MKKGIALLLAVLLMTFSGCVKEPEQTQSVTTAPAETETIPQPTVTTAPELPSEIVTPEEMPSAPEADAELPPQPQPTIITE